MNTLIQWYGINKGMIEIDGASGEGGGQLLRTAVALSAVCGEPVRVFDVRAGRDNPGLRPQHLKAVEAVGLLCDARVRGLAVGSREIEFTPGGIRAGTVRVDVGTAGSATLVLQALLPVALSAPGEVEAEVVGGTDVSRSPSADYFRHVFLRILSKAGCEIEAEVVKRGFYPKGGGIMRLRTKPWKPHDGIIFGEPGGFIGLSAYSVASEHLRAGEVAERQANGFFNAVSAPSGAGFVERGYSGAESVGSSFTACARYSDTVLGACVLGERGLKAEDVGARAAVELCAGMASGAALDRHMGDQIVPYLALAGGDATSAELTEHCRTNVAVANMFSAGVKVSGNRISGPGF
jgi:RNA 3'-phosphate cyclase